MTEYERNRRTNLIAGALVITLSGGIFAGALYTYPDQMRQTEVTALAEENRKELKWTKQAIEEGITLDADNLWPEEKNPVITEVYRNGKDITESMVTITSGSVYHFHGQSDDAILYTEIYPGFLSGSGSEEQDVWYRLLPSQIREDFEENGWTWEVGWEYDGRVHLDGENRCIRIKSADPTAILYGMGLYLDQEYGYAEDAAFEQEADRFQTVFGNTQNSFASALECYYVKGGELRSTCPKIYAMIADVMLQLDTETAEIREATKTETQPESEEDTEKPAFSVMDTDSLLGYVNEQREKAGLLAVTWDSENEDAVCVRAEEVNRVFSQTRPDGTEAFSAYTDTVMSEMRLEQASDVETIYHCAENYFLMENLKSFVCTVYENVAVLAFIW